MKILITGGAGFIGKWVVERLSADIEVVVVDALDPQVHKASHEFSLALQARARCIRADIRDIEAYREAAEGVDVVLHLAAQTGTGQSMYELSRYIQHNVDGTARLLELVGSLEKRPQRIILSSSRAVYGEGAFADGPQVFFTKGRRQQELLAGIWEVCNGHGVPLEPLPMRETQLPNPTSVYGFTKLWQEQLLQIFCESQGIEALVFRFQNVYGPGQELGNPYTGIIGIFTNAVVRGSTVELFEDGLMTRDFVYVGDVADAVVRGSTYPGVLSEIVNVGSGRSTTLRDLVETIAAVTGKEPSIKVSGRFRVGDIRHATADMDHYRSLFGQWTPTSLVAGLRTHLEWYLMQETPKETGLRESLREMERRGLLLGSQ